MPETLHIETGSVQDQLDLLSMAEGFFQAQILFALQRLRVFELIGESEKSANELAAEIAAVPETLARVLNAGVMLKLLQSGDGIHYRVTPKWRPFLLPQSGGSYLGDWLQFLASVNNAYSQLDVAVRKNRPVIDLWDNGMEKDIRQSTRAMHNYAVYRGKELAHFLDLDGCRSLLDLGCGPGTYAFALGTQYPALKLALADQPEVLTVAREIAAEYALENEVAYLPLNILADDIPGRYDVILLSNALHMFGESSSRRLLQRLYDALNPGGSLVVQEPFLNNNRIGPRWPVFVDLNLLCVTPEGRNHSREETCQWMEEAGFRDIQFCGMSILNVNSFLRGFKSNG